MLWTREVSGILKNTKKKLSSRASNQYISLEGFLLGTRKSDDRKKIVVKSIKKVQGWFERTIPP